MNRILFAFLEILAAALFLLPLYCILNKVRFHSIRKTAAYCLFSFYLVAVYSLAGMPCITYIHPDFNRNLIPFAGMLRDLKNSILNVALFVPLGLLLPCLWARFRKFGRTLLFGFGLSLAVELGQLLTRRATDVNDLITNVLGTAVGFGLYRLLRRSFPGLETLGEPQEPRDTALICLWVLGVMFFLQPFPAAWLWDVFAR